uniref:Uncharacterized protein n=1 Tax=Mus musculus TaxID=10090 RepID=Q3TNR5_MOUSE|nr:unnamed protein product [Mus musculus]
MWLLGIELRTSGRRSKAIKSKNQSPTIQVSGIQLMIFWAPPRAWVISPAMPFVAPVSSSRLQMPVLHCCCSWWSSHGTGISKTLHDPFSPGRSIATEAALSPMAFHGLSQCQASAALLNSFMPSKPVPPG